MCRVDERETEREASAERAACRASAVVTVLQLLLGPPQSEQRQAEEISRRHQSRCRTGEADEALTALSLQPALVRLQLLSVAASCVLCAVCCAMSAGSRSSSSRSRPVR